MAENSISGIIDVTLDRLKAIANAETIIGDPIEKGDITIIPVSKVSFGVATGGSDFSSKNTNAPMFGGGGGAGVTVAPIALLVIKNDIRKILVPYVDEFVDSIDLDIHLNLIEGFYED